MSSTWKRGESPPGQSVDELSIHRLDRLLCIFDRRTTGDTQYRTRSILIDIEDSFRLQGRVRTQIYRLRLRNHQLVHLLRNLRDLILNLTLRHCRLGILIRMHRGLESRRLSRSNEHNMPLRLSLLPLNHNVLQHPGINQPLRRLTHSLVIRRRPLTFTQLRPILCQTLPLDLRHRRDPPAQPSRLLPLPLLQLGPALHQPHRRLISFSLCRPSPSARFPSVL